MIAVLAAEKARPWRRCAPTFVAARLQSKRQAAYRNTPGQYSDVWDALRVRFGVTALDIAKSE
jgi:hypothetical protein